MAGQGVSAATVSLLCNGKLDTLTLGQGDPRLLRTNNKDVTLTGSEGVVYGILDVDDVETTIVSLTVSDDTNTTHVAAAGDHDDDTSVELDEVSDLASGKLNLDGVVDLDIRVGVADAVQNNVSTKSWRGYIQPSFQSSFGITQQTTGWFDQSLIQRLNDV